jgi:hypothetical protein
VGAIRALRNGTADVKALQDYLSSEPPPRAAVYGGVE